MTFRTTLATTATVSLAFAAGAATAWLWWARPAPAPERTAAATAPAATWYTCGMHPEVVQDHPGTCPKCGMALQPMAADRAAALGLAGAAREPAPAGARAIAYWKSSMIPGEIHTQPGKDAMGMDLVPVYTEEIAAAGAIQIDPVVEQNMGVRVDTTIRGPVNKAVRTVGFVDYDETSLAVVTTKVDGWVERLYVDKTGVQIHAGDPLFEFYAPELFSAQEEYLSARRNLQKVDIPLLPRSRIDSETLVREARTRLVYFDISAEQIAELERTGKARKTLTMRAPYTGIVTEKDLVQGQRIVAGMPVMRIADLSTVWVMAKVFEYDAPYVKLGQEAFMALSYLPGKTFRGRVTYVYPYLEAKTREVPVRMEFHNPGYELKPGMYATVTLIGEVAREATLVPDVAVLDTGLRSIVFVMPRPGRFEAREVKTGPRTDDNYVQVLSGLAPGETVVVSGQFLLDSESRLREAALKFLEPGTTSAAAPIAVTTERAAAGPEGGGSPGEGEGSLYYVCPMPEHADILYDAPGKCPLCAMAMVPVRRHGGQVDIPRPSHWTCPMPDHAQVREPGPGKCPICGMTLIPAAAPPRDGNLPAAPSAGASERYVCPMPEHADVVADAPGKCPRCGMDLVPAPTPTAGTPPVRGPERREGGHAH